jgi:hypothetical protein
MCTRDARRPGELAVIEIWNEKFPNFGNLPNNILVVKAALANTSFKLPP